MQRKRITVQEVATDPTNAYEVTVHGDAAIKSLRIHGSEAHPWVYVEYMSGGSSAGSPAHWASYVRVVAESPAEEYVRDNYPDAFKLMAQGWTLDAAMSHIEGTCDITLCNHESHGE